MTINDIINQADQFKKDTGKSPQAVHLTQDQINKIKKEAQSHAVIELKNNGHYMHLNGMLIVKSSTEGPHFST